MHVDRGQDLKLNDVIDGMPPKKKGVHAHLIFMIFEKKKRRHIFAFSSKFENLMSL